MIIQRISIKNFRSIENCKIDLENMNIFAGCNDSGKSNLLKALNLFFNNKTDHDTEFDFDSDFCHFATVPNKTASEVEIELTLSPPSTYKDSRNFVWQKKWRKDFTGVYEEKMYIPPSKKSEVYNLSKTWARRIRYRYVPAMKGDNYFPHLMRDLHSTLAISIDKELKQASRSFVDTISEHTISMLDALNVQLNLNSQIRLPSNLSTLFEVLDFGTQHRESSISINRRGDGVKIRHIPSILKFLHDEENRIKTRGSVKVNTIWGYEEPENNLEFSSAFEKSEELFGISRKIQTLITSHSPAFYNLKRNRERVNLYYTLQGLKGTSYTQICSDTDLELVNDDMGLLPIVAPYIEEKEKELKLTRASIDQLKQNQTHNMHTLFVEGPTDEIIISYCLKEVFSIETTIIKVISDEAAGATWVRNNMLAWAMNPKVENCTFKAYGLVDKDSAGKEALSTFNDYMKYTGRKAHQGKVKIGQLATPPHIANILQHKNFTLNFAIEELFPSSIWHHALAEGWLEKRNLSNCYNISSLPDDKTLKDIVEETFGEEIETIYLFYKVANDHKKKFAHHVIDEMKNDPSLTEGLEKTLKGIVEFFGVNSPV